MQSLPKLNDIQNLHFQNGEIMNRYEERILTIIEMLLGNHFRCWGQIPLEVICARPKNMPYLPSELFKFWASSRVDIAILDKGQKATRRTKLVIECQSHWHDQPEKKNRDSLKWDLIKSAQVPLLYVRYLDNDSNCYRFYTPDNRQEVFYNFVTHEGKSDLQKLLNELIGGKALL